MIFTDERLNGTGEIIACGRYHRYWVDWERKERNEAFDEFAARVLDLKERKAGAIRYFFELLDDRICRGVTICVVPSSDPRICYGGVGILGSRLAAQGRCDKVRFLIRAVKVPKLAYGGIRSKEMHLRSIVTDESMNVAGEEVLLLDDVATTGNSLMACREILLACGAKRVEMLVIGFAGEYQECRRMALG